MRRLCITSVLFVAAVTACGGESKVPPAMDLGALDLGGDGEADLGGDATVACSSDTQCDDGVFCNGVARCTAPGMAGADARGCVAPTGAPCLPSQSCNELSRACETACGTNPDADGDGFDAVACGGNDCDDGDGNTYPGNPEVCDAAGHSEDCDPTTFGPDFDGDGFISTGCCNTQPGGALYCGDDCSDVLGGANVHPGAPESCNGVDDDCDGTVDDGVLGTFYRDADGDDFGVETDTTQACTRPAGYTDTNTAFDCNDGDRALHPGLAEICNDRDEDCDPATNPWDGDGDGYDDLECGGSDCADANPLVHPGVPDPCDGVDADCSTGRLGEDADMDGHAAASDTCTPGSIPRDDCDDRRSSTHPGAPERCNGLDDDCDGVVDGASAAATCAESLTCAGVCAGVVGVAVGQTHSCAVTSSGSVLCWGGNVTGQLGDGTTLAHSSPARVASLSGALEVSAGSTHTCARTATNVRCWGQNTNGQLGDGTFVPSNVPVTVAGLGAVAELATGYQHTCARTAAGEVWCWGTDAGGQLGNDASLVRSSTPVLVALAPMVAVEITAAGNIPNGHTCARTSTGAVYCWGSNGNGELGDGTTGNRAIPTAVVGLSDAVGISAGTVNTCAIRSTGAVVCWGNNSSGQLGDGSLIPGARTSPSAPVTGLLDATAITVGNAHVCALSTSLGLLCWGNNSVGQLGTGATSATERVPVSASSFPAVEVDADGTHTCARRADGAVYCWGANGDGRVGDGTIITPRPAPTPVLGAS